MLFNKKLTATLLAALILTSATDADAMGFNWRKWALFGAVTTLVIALIRWSHQNEGLINAIHNKNIQAVQSLINNNANVNAPDRFGRIPLIEAAAYGDTEIAQALIDAGADVNAQDRYGKTALRLALENGHTAIAQLLIDANANVNAQHHHNVLIIADTAIPPRDNRTPLMIAACYGDTASAQSLIEHGADVNAQNRFNQTPLMIAAENGHTAIAQLLIDAGADVNAQDRYGKTPLMIAAYRRQWHTADLILNTMHIQQTPEARAILLIAKTPQNTDNQTPAHQALQAVGRIPFVLNALLKTIRPALPTYQWLQEKLGRCYEAYRTWKRSQPGEERFDENYNPNRAAAGPANA